MNDFHMKISRFTVGHGQSLLQCFEYFYNAMQLPSLSSGNLEACVQAIILHLYQLADHTNSVIAIPLQYFTYSK